MSAPNKSFDPVEVAVLKPEAVDAAVAEALAAIAAPLPQVKFCPTGGIGPKNVADYLALKCVATVGGSWMLPADAVKSGNWDEVTRLSREAVEMVKR